MARRIKVTKSCAIKDASVRLADVSSKLQDGTFDFELAQEEVNTIYNEWLETSGSESFGELLAKAGLSGYGF
jgi:hypothetical protein